MACVGTGNLLYFGAEGSRAHQDSVVNLSHRIRSVLRRPSPRNSIPHSSNIRSPASSTLAPLTPPHSLPFSKFLLLTSLSNAAALPLSPVRRRHSASMYCISVRRIAGLSPPQRRLLSASFGMGTFTRRMPVFSSPSDILEGN